MISWGSDPSSRLDSRSNCCGSGTIVFSSWKRRASGKAVLHQDRKTRKDGSAANATSSAREKRREHSPLRLSLRTLQLHVRDSMSKTPTRQTIFRQFLSDLTKSPRIPANTRLSSYDRLSTEAGRCPAGAPATCPRVWRRARGASEVQGA